MKEGKDQYDQVATIENVRHSCWVPKNPQFSSPGRSSGRAIVLPLALALAALAKSLTLKFFYVMGKALSGELSCPCDRSCFFMNIEVLARVHKRLFHVLCLFRAPDKVGF